MSDTELQSILERLILGGFVKKDKICPTSKRTKERQKPDVYYSISYLLLQDVDWLGGDLLDAYRESKSSDLFEETAVIKKDPRTRAYLARSELRKLHITNTSDEDLNNWLKKDAGYPSI